MSVCSDVTVILTVRLLVQEVQQKVFIEINCRLVLDNSMKVGHETD